MDGEIFESGKKKLRIQKYLDTCGRGLRPKAPSTRITRFLRHRIRKYPDSSVHTLSDSLRIYFFLLWRADLFFFQIRCRIRRMRVDGSRIRKEKVADSKISGYVWTGPSFLPIQLKFKYSARTDIRRRTNQMITSSPMRWEVARRGKFKLQIIRR